MCSRAQVARELRIATPAVSGIVRDFLRRQVLSEAGFEESSGGRRRTRLRLNPSRVSAIGIHVAMRRLRGVLADSEGRILAERSDEGAAAGRIDGTMEAICRLIGPLAAQTDAQSLCGVGIGVSGVIRENGRVSRDFPDSERWVDVPLADRVQEKCGMRPLLINDVHAAALGELRFGGWGDASNLVLLHVGDGIAAGMIVDGRLYCGATSNAGEIGHNAAGSEGEMCYCGNRGCLESLAAPRAIVEACRLAVARGVRTLALDEAGAAGKIGFDHILSAAAKGDRLASNLLEEAGRHLGRAAADLINIFDPQVLLLGGILAGPRTVLVDGLERTARARVLPALRESARIEFSRLKDSASVLGAGALAIDDLFSDPAKLLDRGLLQAR
jgi:predicted NBD/HSP70 family sugar kinase